MLKSSQQKALEDAEELTARAASRILSDAPDAATSLVRAGEAASDGDYEYAARLLRSVGPQLSSRGAAEITVLYFACCERVA